MGIKSPGKPPKANMTLGKSPVAKGKGKISSSSNLKGMCK